MKSIGWLALVIASTAGGAGRDEGAPAKALYGALMRGQCTPQLGTLRAAAEAGEPWHQYVLGILLDKGGPCTAADSVAAADWLRRAGERGHTGAMVDLGVMFLRRNGTPQDDAEALVWFRRAAAAGDAEAENRIGHAYARGRGVEQDERQAAAWYRRAADRGYTPAMNDLAECYDFGHGVGRDPMAASRWYLRAAEKEGRAQETALQVGNVGGGPSSSHVLAPELSARVLTDLHDPRAKWFFLRLNAERGHPWAQSRVAAWLADGNVNGRPGRPTVADLVQAYAWALLSTNDARAPATFAAVRDEIAARLNETQRAEGQRLARAWVGDNPLPAMRPLD